MQQIAENLIRKKLDIEEKIPLNIIPARTGKFSSTYFAETPADQDDLVLRIAPPDNLLQLFYEKRMMRQEPALHRLIQQKTDIPVPTILAYDFNRKLIDRDFLIMNRMPGEPLSEVRYQLDQRKLDRVLENLGGYVAKLHQITAKKYGYIGAHRPMEPQPNWHDAFAIMWEKMLSGCLNCGVYSEQDYQLGMDLWERYHSVFRIDCPSSLCHMDLWIQNVLVDRDGNLTALFDFDRSCFGDVGNEVAVAEYCGLTTDAFWQGYGSKPEPTEEWAIRKWFYLLYEHQKYIVISISARHKNPARAQSYADQSLSSMRQFFETGVAEL